MRSNFGPVMFGLCLVALPYGGQAANLWHALNQDSDGRTPVLKELDIDWFSTLDQRGEPTVHTRANSADFEYIGMPVGGIGAGLLYLGGDGKLWAWDLFNTKGSGQTRGAGGHAHPYARSDVNNPAHHRLAQGFAIRVDQAAERSTRTLDRDGFNQIRFRGEYPIGQVLYADPDYPVQIQLEAFSPFAPLDVDFSSYPATILTYTIRNTGTETASGALTGWLQNAVSIQSGEGRAGFERRNRVIADDALHLLEFTAGPADHADHGYEQERDYGSMALALVGGSAGVRGTAAYDEASHQGLDLQASEEIQPFDQPAPVGALEKAFELAPGESVAVIFVLSWYFPNVQGAPIGTTTERSYGRRFASARAVAETVVDELDELTARTRLWHATWHDSTLPWWFLDRTFLNISTLASHTSYIFGDGRFYGFEGEYLGFGTCTHVWGCVQAMGRLFPDLERNLREATDYQPGIGFNPETGSIGHRAEADQAPAVDGHASIILRTLLVHQMQPDHAFLERVYPRMKQAMNFLVERYDADRTGLLTGGQHNTLDAQWFGEITWLSLYYTTALRAAAEMADLMDDAPAAADWRALADRGRDYIERELFNGEYFIHAPDPDHPESPGTYGGCHIDQLLGQSWAYQVGLGAVIDPAKAATALQSIWRYNFTTDVGPYREQFTNGRWFAMPGEGGLLMSTWPYGGEDALEFGYDHFAGYLNECMAGFEYAASSLMMWHGMPYHSLVHTRIMHERHHAARRNPWNEVEWGSHYARSMASYGVFTAACGFEYDGPAGFIAFSPRITPADFRAPFVGAEGWGTFTQRRTERVQHHALEIKWGRLHVQTLAFDLPAGATASRVAVTVDNRTTAHTFTQEGDRVTVALHQPLTAQAGEKIDIRVRYE